MTLAAKLGCAAQAVGLQLRRTNSPWLLHHGLRKTSGGSGERKNLLLSSSHWMQLSLYDYQETIGGLRQLPCLAVNVGITRYSGLETVLFCF